MPLVAKYADVLQIGARNMQNYNLLRAVGETRTAVLLKRGLIATHRRTADGGRIHPGAVATRSVMLCERGIRTFETATRNTTDINAIPVLKQMTHLPVVLDPSHGTGNWEYVTAVARAALAAGADGSSSKSIKIPAHAISDGKRVAHTASLPSGKQVQAVAEAVGRRLAPVAVAPRWTSLNLFPAIFKIAIIGLGLMGGSLALALKEMCRHVVRDRYASRHA